MAITTDSNQQVQAQSPTLDNLPNFDSSLPNVPNTYPTQGIGQPTLGSFGNQYTGPQHDVVNAYRTYLGRDPESAGVVNQWASNPNFLTGIQNSQEAQTLGRARNEINPQITSQEQAIQRNLEASQLAAHSKLQALVPSYNQQFGALQFGLSGQQTALDQALASAQQNAQIATQNVGDQINPAILAVRENAARSGLLNSTVAIDRVNNALSPLTRQIGNIQLKQQGTANDIASKRQAILQKYGFDTQNLIGKRETEAQSIRDQLAQLVQQAQGQQSQLEETRAPQIYSRAGALGDASFARQLEQQKIANQLAEFQAQQAQQNAQFYYGTKKAA